MGKQYAVIGLGRFGIAVALGLAEAGNEVTAVDIDEERVQMVADAVTYAAVADVTKNGVCESLGLGNVDVAIIGISSHMEDSILATIMAKEAGASYIVAKAVSDIHGTILKKVGADQIAFPERDSGRLLAKSISSGYFTKFFSLSDSFSIVEITPPADWVGHSLAEVNPRKNYGVNVIGLIDHGKTRINLDPQEPMQAGWILVVVGDNKELTKLIEHRG